VQVHPGLPGREPIPAAVAPLQRARFKYVAASGARTQRSACDPLTRLPLAHSIKHARAGTQESWQPGHAGSSSISVISFFSPCRVGPAPVPHPRFRFPTHADPGWPSASQPATAAHVEGLPAPSPLSAGGTRTCRALSPAGFSVAWPRSGFVSRLTLTLAGSAPGSGRQVPPLPPAGNFRIGHVRLPAGTSFLTWLRPPL